MADWSSPTVVWARTEMRWRRDAGRARRSWVNCLAEDGFIAMERMMEVMGG